MAFERIIVPENGEKITARQGKLVVPDDPILLWIEGDGIGADIMNASRRIWDAAVQKCYSGQRRVAWCEIYAGRRRLTSLMAITSLKKASTPSGVSCRHQGTSDHTCRGWVP